MSDASLHIAQFTDLHLTATIDGLLRGTRTHATATAVIAAARRRRPVWDAFLLTGDLVHDDVAGYAHLHGLCGPDAPPVYCLPGNHDPAGALRAALAAPPFQVGGEVLQGSWQLILLDSTVPGAAHGRLDALELARLDRALAAHPGRHALVCLHHHVAPTGSRWLDELCLENPDALFEVLDRHPQVRALTWGHVHQLWEGTRRGVKLVSAPSTCVQFAPGVDEFAIDSRPPGYRWFTLHADGRLDTGVEWLDGTTPDAAPAT